MKPITVTTAKKKTKTIVAVQLRLSIIAEPSRCGRRPRSPARRAGSAEAAANRKAGCRRNRGSGCYRAASERRGRRAPAATDISSGPPEARLADPRRGTLVRSPPTRAIEPHNQVFGGGRDLLAGGRVSVREIGDPRLALCRSCDWRCAQRRERSLQSKTKQPWASVEWRYATIA